MIDRKFRNDSLFAYSCQACSAGMILLFTVLVTRYSSLATFGAITALLALSRVLSNLATFRTNEAVVYFFKQGETTGDHQQGSIALIVGVLVDFVVSTLIFFIVCFASEWVAANLLKDVNLAHDVRLFAAYPFFNFLRGAPMGYFQATEQFVIYNLSNAIEQTLRVFIIGYNLLYGRDLTLSAVVWAVILPSALVTTSMLISLMVALIKRIRLTAIGLKRQFLVKFALFSSKTFISTALKAGNQNFDVLVLGYLADTNTVGLYGLIRQFLVPLFFLSNPFTSLIYPKFVKAIAENQRTQVGLSVKKVNNKLKIAYLVLLGLIAPAFATFCWWNDLSPGIAGYCAFALMAMTTFINGQLWWARPFSNAVDPSLSIKANLGATAIFLVLIYPLGWALSIAGVAIVVCAVTLFAAVFYYKALSNYELQPSRI